MWTSGQICDTDVTFNVSVYKDLKTCEKETHLKQMYEDILLFQLAKIIWMEHPFRALLNYAYLSILNLSVQLLIIGVMSSFFWRTSFEEICAGISSVQNLINFLQQNSTKFFAIKLKIDCPLWNSLLFFGNLFLRFGCNLKNSFHKEGEQSLKGHRKQFTEWLFLGQSCDQLWLAPTPAVSCEKSVFKLPPRLIETRSLSPISLKLSGHCCWDQG